MLGCGGGVGKCVGEVSGDGSIWGSVGKCVGVYGR